jgi:hypothetical protein
MLWSYETGSIMRAKNTGWGNKHERVIDRDDKDITNFLDVLVVDVAGHMRVGASRT